MWTPVSPCPCQHVNEGQWEGWGQEGGVSSVGKMLDQKARHRFNSLKQQHIFLPQSIFSADSLMVFAEAPCGIMCINICEHVKKSRHW